MSSSLKSVQSERVRLDRALRFGSESRDLGNPALCPTQGEHLSYDVFGRPANQNTLAISYAPCAVHSEFPGRRIIAVENAHRPYMPICADTVRSSTTRSGDLMGVGRDKSPQNLYGEGTRGNFVQYAMPPSQFPQGILTQKKM